MYWTHSGAAAVRRCFAVHVSPKSEWVRVPVT